MIDVSPENNWSEVRVWYAPIRAIGGSVWPVQGFIYPGKPPRAKLSESSSAPANLLPKTSLLSKTNNAPIKSRAAKAGRDPIGDIIGRRMGW